jgi:hypothetical protein
VKLGDYAWLLALSILSAGLLVPSTRQVFISLTQEHPYVMGFLKFAILATMGELLVIRLLSGQWKKTAGMFPKAIVWGIVGMLVVLMFEIYLNGVAGAVKKQLLYVGDGAVKPVLTAFFISAIMNLTFGPVFMAAHRMTDLYIDRKSRGVSADWTTIVENIDWQGFVKFVVAKTVPFFWIPAHTVVFLLPPEYRVLVAAYLSIALGAILAYARRRKSEACLAE